MAQHNQTLQAIRGMHDLLPANSARWQAVETIIREVLSSYAYQEIRLPIVEKTELFKRSIGEVTDIVEKEMYTFTDRNGDSLTLRPEGTAGCLRAGLEHGLLHNQIHRLWYYGAMFRHERPQKGRYRQFYQFGVETYGMASADIDVELIALSNRIWQRLGINNQVVLELNSLGTIAERLVYREVLVAYFTEHLAELDADSLKRLKSNPLRILDTKNPAMQTLVAQAPELSTYLGAESLAHFNILTTTLDALGIQYRLNPRLVRGLDYYSNTVFEWVTTALGSQGTICAGGRYDGLVAQLGGKDNTACGFALGMERLMALIDLADNLANIAPVEVYLIRVGEDAKLHGMKFAEHLRAECPTLKLQVDCNHGSFKSQFKKADKSGAEFAFIIGEDEVNNQTIAIKPLRTKASQFVLPANAVIEFIQTHVTAEN